MQKSGIRVSNSEKTLCALKRDGETQTREFALRPPLAIRRVFSDTFVRLYVSNRSEAIGLAIQRHIIKT